MRKFNIHVLGGPPTTIVLDADKWVSTPKGTLIHFVKNKKAIASFVTANVVAIVEMGEHEK